MISPSRFLIITFLTGILIGGLLLSLPIAASNGKSIGLLNAFFTATSAICVTGLIVVDTAKDFSLFGKFIVLFLIQIGGLGIMTFSTAFYLLIKKNLSIKEKLYLKEDTNSLVIGDIRTFIKKIFYITLIIELIGAVIMFPVFFQKFSFNTALGHSVFHSISAFCNAGFSTFSDSLCRFRDSYIINFVICILIILGGLGFIVISEVINFKKQQSISLHSKIVIYVTIFLVIFGSIAFYFFEYSRSNATFTTSFLGSIFQSVTTRTAGFNTVDISVLHNSTIFLFIIFMIIGASPGSTGGGIKTTTFTLIGFSILNAFRGEDRVNINKTHLSSNIVIKSYMLLAIYLLTSCFFITILMYSEPNVSFKEIIFEVFSAFGTVGLSLGITAKLTSLGKFIIIMAMFAGRVGPLTLINGIQFNSKKAMIKYPEVKIPIG